MKLELRISGAGDQTARTPLADRRIPAEPRFRPVYEIRIDAPPTLCREASVGLPMVYQTCLRAELRNIAKRTSRFATANVTLRGVLAVLLSRKRHPAAVISAPVVHKPPSEGAKCTLVKNEQDGQEIHNPKQIRRSRGWIGAIALVFVAVVAVEIGIAIYRAEPILKGRVIETLSARFHSRVELARFHVSVAHGLQISGEGLKIFGTSDPNIHKPGIQPLIAIKEF